MGVLIACLLAWHGSVEMLKRKEGRRPSQLVFWFTRGAAVLQFGAKQDGTPPGIFMKEDENSWLFLW